MVPLGEICEIQIGRTPARNNPDFWGPGEAWLSIADMNQGNRIRRTKETITPLAAQGGKRVMPGTVLLSFKLSIGKVGITQVPLYTNEAIAALPIKTPAEVEPTYLMRALQSLDLTTGSNRAAMGATLNKTSLGEIRIPLPSLSRQRRIAAILDHADALRVKRRQVLAQLDSLTQSIFHDMFESKEFDSTTLGAAIKWSSGKFLPAKDQQGGRHPVYGGNGVNGWHDKFMFEKPVLVVGRVGANCGAVHVTNARAWVTDNALVASLKRDDLILAYLRPALAAANLNQFAGVSGQPSISAGKIAHVHLPTPPLAVQEDFAKRITSIDEQRLRVLESASHFDLFFASLQSRAFRGEL